MPGKKLKHIALVTDGIQPYVMGGMQQHSAQLARFFARNKIHVDLYHFSKNDQDIDQLDCFTEGERAFIHSINIPFPQLKKLPGHYLRASWQHAKGVYDALTKRPVVDFIYVQGLTGLELVKQKSKGEKLPPIAVNFHGLEMFQPNAGVKNQLAAMQLRRLVKFCFQRTDYVISFGGKIRQIVEQLKVPSRKIIEMPLGIEREWLVGSVAETVLPVKLLFVGRFERRKGIPELNEVMRLSIGQVPVEFHLAGPIPQEARLHHPLIHYHGAISDREAMQQLYHECDILICPSLAEGMPTVIVEAMASGLAVIATDVGAVSQLVNAENGWLVSSGDIHAMHKAIQSACKNPEVVTNKKTAALQFASSHLMWENVIEDLIREVELRMLPEGKR